MPKLETSDSARSTKVEQLVEGRKILYPKPDVQLLIGEKALKVAQAKKILKWETETEFTARMLRENTNANPELYLLKDENGEKIICWSNSKNRPFDESWCRLLVQTILNGDFELNLENIIIGETGLVISGQHRLIALILAEQIREKNPEKYPHWRGPVTLETTIAFGCRELPRVVMTIDNVKPRTLADVLYTSDVFRDLTPSDRKECSRMLDNAIDLLWRRTGEGQYTDPETGKKVMIYQTHSESRQFLDRRPKLLDCVRHIFELNRGRVISKLRLSAGQCAACCYLMGSANTNPSEVEIRSSDHELDWSMWELAFQFWQDLVKGNLRSTVEAIYALVDVETGMGGRMVEKLCVLAKSWGGYVSGVQLSREQIALRYKEVDDYGRIELDENPKFGGIDIGYTKPVVSNGATPSIGDALTQEELETAKALIRDEERAAMAAAKPKPKPKAKSKTTV